MEAVVRVGVQGFTRLVGNGRMNLYRRPYISSHNHTCVSSRNGKEAEPAVLTEFSTFAAPTRGRTQDNVAIKAQT